MEESSFLHPERAVRAANIHEGMRVADFGAGSGHFSLAAARAVGHEGVVWAVDTDPGLLSRVKNLSTADGLHNVEVIRGDIEQEGGSTLPPGSFDFVIIANTLFSADDKAAVARETARVLKSPTGRALVIDWKESFEGLGPHPDHVVTAAAAKKTFEDNGFVVVNDLPVGHYHWGFVVRKK
jgi:ubiquinone/menaquinone biosynthesis C-methylase UbiE